MMIEIREAHFLKIFNSFTHVNEGNLIFAIFLLMGHKCQQMKNARSCQNQVLDIIEKVQLS